MYQYVDNLELTNKCSYIRYSHILITKNDIPGKISDINRFFVIFF